MKTFFKRLVLMFQFFTRIPIPVALSCGNEDFGKGLALSPLVGLFIGGVLYGGYTLAGLVFPPMISAVLTVLLYVAITGGLHIDGLADTFDGLLAGKDRERTLEIMKDSRIGTHGAVSVILLLLFYVVLLPEIHALALLLMPVAGKTGALVCAAISRYAREQGLGKHFIDHCGIKELFIGITLVFLSFYVFFSLKGIVLAFISVVTAWLLTLALTRKVRGATGDILGATAELNQVLFLLAAFFLAGV
ncbi:MAG: adenosylcobinamide-GDP ribazoletransferase [Clostridia bacterium]